MIEILVAFALNLLDIALAGGKILRPTAIGSLALLALGVGRG